MSNDGTKAESMESDAAAAVDDEAGGGGGGTGRRNDLCSAGVDSFSGELAVDEDDDDEDLDSSGSEDGIGLERSFGKELHGDREGFWS